MLGDLSYGDCVGRLWDSYGEMIEPLSSQIPWMVCPGNHEIEHIFVNKTNAAGENKSSES
jgi:Calcineurin-like phosphoesterase